MMQIVAVGLSLEDLAARQGVGKVKVRYTKRMCTDICIYHSPLITMLYHHGVRGSSSRELARARARESAFLLSVPSFSRRVRLFFFEDVRSPSPLLSKTAEESDRAADLVKAHERLSPRTIHLPGPRRFFRFSRQRSIQRKPSPSFSFSLSRFLVTNTAVKRRTDYLFFSLFLALFVFAACVKSKVKRLARILPAYVTVRAEQVY